MKRVIVPLGFPAMTGDEVAEVDFEISDPGDIVECLLQVKPVVGGIVMAGNANKPQFEMIPVMLANIDPDAQSRKRHFLIGPPMQTFDSDYEIIYRGRFLFPEGKMLVIFEELKSEPKSNLVVLP